MVHVTGKSIMAFLTGQSWHIIKSRCTGVGPEQGYRCFFSNRLNQTFGNIIVRNNSPKLTDNQQSSNSRPTVGQLLVMPVNHVSGVSFLTVFSERLATESCLRCFIHADVTVGEVSIIIIK